MGNVWPEYKFFEDKRWRTVSVHLHKPQAIKKVKALRKQGLNARLFTRKYSSRGDWHAVYKSNKKRRKS